MDLLLLEEATVSPEFLAWLIRRTFSEAVALGALEATYHSKFDADGESDLIIQFRASNGTRHALLIENKINAPPQSEQAQRYRKRAEQARVRGEWDEWRTCIVAPKHYLDGKEKSGGYDAQLAYEDIAGWFENYAATDPRAAYRASVVRDAIVRARRTGVSKEDPVVTEFWRAYWAEASTHFPELEMKPPTVKGPQSTWITFRPKFLGGVRTIDHKLDKGFVDLTLNDVTAERLDSTKAQLDPALDPRDMEVTVTGAVLAVRVRVPLLEVRSEFGPQLGEARAGMRAGYRLLYLSRALRVAGERSERD